MHLLVHKGTDPYFNMALEEYILCRTSLDIIILWRNDRAVVVGRNQNTVEEIDSDFVREKGVAVVRRLSGGGAVFHDTGNINFTVIQAAASDDFANYIKFTSPVIDFLHELGVNAKLEGRNDLVIDGMKFCGNAQTIKNGRFMHHGCILYNADVAELAGALRPKEAKFESKSVKSVRARVTNIASHIQNPPEAGQFFESLADYFRRDAESIREYILTPCDAAQIEALAESKYKTWDWNYGASPDYNFSNAKKFGAGFVDVRLSVKSGVIEAAKIYGDFFGLFETAGLEAALAGVQHDRVELAAVLKDIDLSQYIHGISQDEFLDLLQ